MEVDGESAEANIANKELIDVVFSWSFKDVLNQDLYKDKVEQIPLTFQSISSYMKSFVVPLMAESHAELRSSFDTVASAPTYEVQSVEPIEEDKPSKFYSIEVKSSVIELDPDTYERKSGDIIALTDVTPKGIDDLNRPTLPYILALVLGSIIVNGNVKIQILPSKPLLMEQLAEFNCLNSSLFAVFLVNMTTNIRIWSALHFGLEGRNMKIIEKVLQPDPTIKERCNRCLKEGIYRLSLARARAVISSFSLNDSQYEAVSNCLALSDCHHDTAVKLIWGPPGTGKTKTIGVLLFALLGKKCRTLTCAPTNIAVLEVTARLLQLVRESNSYENYGLGDIVLFGNGDRMKINDHDELLHVFLDYRATVLAKCFAPASGWKHCLELLISLLEHPEQVYQMHLRNGQEEDDCCKEDYFDNDNDAHDEQENGPGEDRLKMQVDISPGLRDENKRIWEKVISQTLKSNRNWEKKYFPSEKHTRSPQKGNHYNLPRNARPSNFNEFVMKRFKSKMEMMTFCVVNLCTHLPTSFLPFSLVNDMKKALHVLQYFGTLLQIITAAGGDLREVLGKTENMGPHANASRQIDISRRECLQILKSLPKMFFGSEVYDKHSIKVLILENAYLFFCTAASSVRMHITSVDLLIVDEAAQLKECESTIPLQLPSLRHAMLIGDERQLPALVKSKVCEAAKFGRSLFTRLVLTGYRKHLLNIQYRMHPAISSFPNKEFYQNQIVDAPNVRERTYQRCFLDGDIYGPYSFINVDLGNDESTDGHSFKNMVEVALVCKVVSNLFKESVARGQRVRIGIISPYNAQVLAIKETLDTAFDKVGKSDFSVEVRSLDGFQGGEKDVIIISTVRRNGNGSVGFLCNDQRVNVALTRARHCLWIFGDGTTLRKGGGSLWKKLIHDAKTRKCYYDAHQDQELAKVLLDALVDTDLLDIKLNKDALLFRDAKLKVSVDDKFWKSMRKVTDLDIRKKALYMLSKLSGGQYQPHKKYSVRLQDGISSQLLNLYEVDGPLHIISTADVLKEKPDCIQSLKVLDLSPLSEIPNITDGLNISCSNSTVNPESKLNCVGGKLSAPVTCLLDPTTPGQSCSVNLDPMLMLCKKFAALTLKDTSE